MEKELCRRIGRSHLSLEEKGMILILADLNPDVSLTAEYLQERIADRPGTILRVLRNLERKGILEREQERDEQGHFCEMHWRLDLQRLK